MKFYYAYAYYYVGRIELPYFGHGFTTEDLNTQQGIEELIAILKGKLKGNVNVSLTFFYPLKESHNESRTV